VLANYLISTVLTIILVKSTIMAGIPAVVLVVASPVGKTVVIIAIPYGVLIDSPVFTQPWRNDELIAPVAAVILVMTPVIAIIPAIFLAIPSIGYDRDTMTAVTPMILIYFQTSQPPMVKVPQPGRAVMPPSPSIGLGCDYTLKG
jgi:hypothetical protein